MTSYRKMLEAKWDAERAAVAKEAKRASDENCTHPSVGKLIRDGKVVFYAYLNGYDRAPVEAARWQTLVAKLEA